MFDGLMDGLIEWLIVFYIFTKYLKSMFTTKRIESSVALAALEYDRIFQYPLSDVRCRWSIVHQYLALGVELDG